MDKKVVVDTDTGEVMYAVVEVRKKYFTGGFFMGIQEGFLHISKLDLTGEQHKILLFIFAKLDFENWLRLSQTDIAAELGMQKQHVNRAMKVLVEKGIIHKGPKVGNQLTYRLDPSFGFKGRAKNERAVRSDIARLAKERGLQVIEGNAK